MPSAALSPGALRGEPNGQHDLTRLDHPPEGRATMKKRWIRTLALTGQMLYSRDTAEALTPDPKRSLQPSAIPTYFSWSFLPLWPVMTFNNLNVIASEQHTATYFRISGDAFRRPSKSFLIILDNPIVPPMEVWLELTVLVLKKHNKRNHSHLDGMPFTLCLFWWCSFSRCKVLSLQFSVAAPWSCLTAFSKF